jgi:pilus assembly protein FimV
VYKPKLLQGLVGALLLAPWIAHAASLGNLTVRSSLGQPLLAEIDLFSVGKEEASSLDVRLASQEAYRQADMQYGAALIGMRLSIEKRPNGSLYVRVMSSRPVNEPFLNLVVELHSGAGRYTREYTALIDPPGYTPPQTAAVTPPSGAPSQAEARPAPPRPEPRAVATPSPAGAKQYGPVKRGDTLGKIAASVKPEGISLEQMLVGIFRSNPDAFINNNMNLIRAGATLQIPDGEQLAGIPRRDAAQEIRVQTNDWNRYRRRLSDRPATATERPETPGKREPRVKVDDKAAGDKGKDVLRLSKGQPGGKKSRTIEDRVQALEEELIARERALNEANQRIKDLEKAVKESPK